YSLEQLDKAFRGQLLDPKSAKDKDLAERARKDINTILSGPGRESILSRYKDEAELLNAGHAIQTNMADFSIYQDSLLKVQETDAQAAISQFRQTYEPRVYKRDELLKAFETQVNNVKSDTEKETAMWSWAGGGALIVILIVSVLIGAHQTTAVNK